MTQSEIWGLRRRWFAWGINQVMKVYEPRIAERKLQLFGGLNGRILEIGPGTGVNFKYLNPNVDWIGLEYNQYMFPYLAREADRYGIKHKLVQGSAQEMPLPDNSVDYVIGTLVLCSVPNPVQVLREIERVLKPGGRYVFVEHVAAESGTLTGMIQSVVKPLWCCCADGCHPDRKSWATIETAGFAEVAIDHFKLKFPVVSPHISGYALKG
jgi:ubiquinone/menaquinone biosynthesis C-methylase UbiE